MLHVVQQAVVDGLKRTAGMATVFDQRIETAQKNAASVDSAPSNTHGNSSGNSGPTPAA